MTCILALLTSTVLFTGSNAHGETVNHCRQFAAQPKIAALIQELSAKLKYDHKEFCENPRIADIYREEKLVYHREDDKWHPYEFVTVHYYEYSCQYKYSWDEGRWKDQYCYSTF
ncbi:MAG TPA: hypothetical protein PKC28_12640 [Bdellovibrionales bacterium]|nr:hypothetical protein [Bdellovibrionales bacterium]